MKKFPNAWDREFLRMREDSQPSLSEQAQNLTKMAKDISKWRTSNAKDKADAHKAAGEAHLEAAAHTEGAQRQYHLEQAAKHANKAGDSWDESAHPRDENGKFA